MLTSDLLQNLKIFWTHFGMAGSAGPQFHFLAGKKVNEQVLVDTHNHYQYHYNTPK